MQRVDVSTKSSSQDRLITMVLLLLILVTIFQMVPVAIHASESELLWSYDTGEVHALSLSSNGQYIATHTRIFAEEVYDTISLMKRENGELVWSYNMSGYLIGISSEGDYIAVIGEFDETIYVFNRLSGEPIWSCQLGVNDPSIHYVVSAAMSSNGQYIAAGTLGSPQGTVGPWIPDNRVYLLSQERETPLWSMKVEGEVTSVAISSDGQYLAAGITSSAHGGVYLFSRDNDTPLWSYMTSDEVDLVSFSTDGQYIAVASYDTIYLFNRESETPLWSYTVEKGAAESLAISSNGQYTTVGVYYEGVYLFSRDTGTPLWSYTIQEVNVFPEVHISSDGNFIVAANNEKIYLFTRESGTPLWSYNLGEYARSISLSSDGQYIAVGSDKENHGKVYLFSQETAKSETVTSELTIETTSVTTEMIDTSIDEKRIDDRSFYNSVHPYLAILIIAVIAASIGGLFYIKSSHLKRRIN